MYDKLISPGELFIVDTFAGVRVKVKIIKVVDIDKKIYEAKLTNKSDIKKLSNAGVPITAKDKDEPFYVFGFQIVNKVNNRRKRKIIRK